MKLGACSLLVGSCVVSACTYAADTGVWAATGAMSQARAKHTATLLPNGKVLVAGGSDANNALSSVELYDPGTGTWANTGPMGYARRGHTATLLPSQVLVAGGNDTSSAELYSPATGIWSTTSAPSQVRYNSTATLLSNGTVLVVGGRDVQNTLLANAELYDPASKTWTTTGSMTQGCESRTATLLRNGKVLATGGNCWNSGNGAEVYDPVTGTWDTVGSMAQARKSHTATLLSNSQVLVVGGDASTELYEPATETWSNTTPLSQARYNHTATLLPNGKVLITGGLRPADGSAIPDAEIYNPVSSTWASAGSSGQARAGHTATLLPNGKTLIVGGGNNVSQNTAFASAELYTPAKLFTMTITKAGMGNGTITSSLSGIDCGSDCTEPYPTGKKVTLTAGAAADSSFTGWSGGCSGTKVTCTVTMNETKNITATFTSYSLIVVKTGTGTITSAPAGIDCGNTCSKNYAPGTQVTLTATFAQGLAVSWSGACSGTASTCTVTMDASKNVTANILEKRPDFVVTDVSIRPAQPMEGESFSASIIIKNQGALAGSPVSLGIWADQGTSQNCNATPDTLISSAQLSPLNVGESRLLTVTGLSASAGTKTLRVFVDSTCAAAELDETNNQFTFPYTVVTTTSLPDFFVKSITLSTATPKANTPFNVTVTVKNSGAAGDAGYLDAWPNLITPPTCSTTKSNFWVYVGVMAAGEEKTFTLTLPSGPVTSNNTANRVLALFIDGDCNTRESSETNNTLAKGYQLDEYPDLVVTNIGLPSSMRLGTKVSFLVTIKNQGTVASTANDLGIWIDNPNVIACRANPYNGTNLPFLNAGEIRNFALDVGLTTLGTKTFRAFADHTCVLKESDENNNQLAKQYTVVP